MIDSLKSYERWVPLLLPDYQVLPVTEALRKALLAMRRPESSRWLWVNQLCISQDTPREVAV